MAEREEGIEVHWTQPARMDIYDIMDFMIEIQRIPLHVVEGIIESIFEETESLGTFPQKGKREKLLMNRTLEYRSLPMGDFKVVYHPTLKRIYIATVFNTNQDPNRLLRKVSQAERKDWEK